MKGYRTKRIDLPGGKSIEIVYFAEEGAEAAARDAVTTAGPAAGDDPLDAHEHDHLPAIEAGDPLRDAGAPVDLHVCPSCDSDLVYPVSWEERDGDAWHIERRCPNCEWRHAGEYGQDEVEVFDDVLNDGTEDLLITLRTFARSNMEADVERLIDAINADRIIPMDF
ncbi:hypothetical protein [Miltoncostaea marina]|uniref:hypothetical protein n=1 Tax=Miltoncostaea marina TaxID=2843215 RepID=UPI001C3C336A|nr:hypothetical protein [Miltoncostaea marina]